MPKNKMAIFDMDGTIIDSVPDITDAINTTLTKFGFANRSREEVKTFVGNGAKKIVERSVGVALSDEKIEEMLLDYNAYYTSHCALKSYVYDGVGLMLKELKNRGYLLAIVTNKPKITADVVYEKYFKEYEFVKVLGPEKGGSCKPSKETTVNLLKEFNVKNRDAYFIGDGDTDALTAINAKINGISCLWGYKSQQDLIKAGAKLFAKKPSDILDIIK